MKLHDFLECKYVAMNIHNQKSYSPYRAAATVAANDLINLQKRLYKYIAYFVLLYRYVEVRLGLKTISSVKEMVNEFHKS